MSTYSEFLEPLINELKASGAAPYQAFSNFVVGEGLTNVGFFKIEGSVLHNYNIINCDLLQGDALYSQLNSLWQMAEKQSETFRFVVSSNIRISEKRSAEVERIIAASPDFVEQKSYSVVMNAAYGDRVLYLASNYPKDISAAERMIQDIFSHKGDLRNFSYEKRQVKKGALVKKCDPFMVYVMIALNTIMLGVVILSAGSVFLAFSRENLMRFGAMNIPAVAQGEYYRLFTAFFLHGGFTHYASNMAALYIFGTRVERYYGHWLFIAIYVISGLVGSAAQIFVPAGTVGVGASGAIFGLNGAAFALALYMKKSVDGLNLYALLMLIIFSMAVGFASPNVGNYAHVGGLVTGFLLGLIFCKLIKTRLTRKQDGTAVQFDIK